MMNCDTIDSILDERRVARLSAAERQSVGAHLKVCERCADASAAHDALSEESMGAPPPELWARVLGRVAEARDVRQAAGRGIWVGLAGVAAAAAVAVVAVRLLVVAPENETSIREAEPAAAFQLPFVADRRYVELATPALAAETVGKIAVHEFFMFLCFPCFALEDELERWSSEAQGYMALTRVPAMFYPEAQLHARAFYTAEALGKLEQMHAAFYDEIHVRGNRLTSRAALAEFFARFGIDAAAFDAAFDSSEVDARVRRAAALGAEYDVRVTPTLVVAGRYATHPGLAGDDTLAVVEQLVGAEAERAVVRWVQQTNGGPPSRELDDLLRPVDRVEAYARLLEAADDPKAPPFIQLALERARAGLSAEQIAEAERRYRARRATR